MDADRLIRDAMREAIVLAERLDPKRADRHTAGVTFWPLTNGPERDWGNRWAAAITWDDVRRRDETEAGEGESALSAVRGLVSLLEVLAEKGFV